MFHKAVVITGDRARPHIGARPDCGITDIAKMVHLGTFAQHSVFHFNEITNLGTFG